MEELKRAFNDFQEILKRMESEHKTDIDSFYNLDEDAREEMRGDWTERDLENYDYILHRASIIREAMKIIEEERIAWRIQDRK